MKSLKRIFLVLSILIVANITSAQYSSTKTFYPRWSAAPVAGMILPIGILADNMKPGGTVGLDVGYRVNKEVGMYAKFGYYFMNSKITGAPVGKYIEYSIGPRYFFTKANLKSSLFMEAGVGGYTFMQDSFINPIDEGGVNQISDTRPGLNAGIGANLSLSKSVDILIKTKYNVLFTPNGSSSFITAVSGLEFKF